MKSIRGRGLGLFAIPVAVLSVFAAPFAGAQQSSGSEAVSRPAFPVILRAGPAAGPSFVGPDPSLGAMAARATFRVNYRGFTPEAKRAFRRAVDQWARMINSPVTITVDASFVPLGTNILGSAGPSKIHQNFPRAPRNNTWYFDAVANKIARRQLHPSPDIIARFSSNFANWHFGSNPAPAGQFDFTSVVMHELGHGLGFAGAGRVSGARGTVRLSGLPTAYDLLVENRAGKSLLSFPDNSSQLGTQLTGGNLFFNSARVRRANNRRRAKLFAPPVFQQGSSYSHLDEATFGPGNANSLMTPQIGPEETIRSPGPITRAIFQDIGW